jgi:hypothetical protein
MCPLLENWVTTYRILEAMNKTPLCECGISDQLECEQIEALRFFVKESGEFRSGSIGASR